jgi:hypothetical protein
VMALACDMTGVASFQWTDTEAMHTFPWLSLGQNHHYYQHDGGFRPAECEKIYNWYSMQHYYLLDAMAKTDMGGHSLLDESVVFFGSELSDPPSPQQAEHAVPPRRRRRGSPRWPLGPVFEHQPQQSLGHAAQLVR